MVTTKKGPMAAANSHRPVGRHRNGPMKRIHDEALDIAANQSIAHARLQDYVTVDAHMDRWQERGYACLEAIARADQAGEAQRLAREALMFFSQAEALERMAEQHVAQGDQAVLQAKAHTSEVIAIAEEDLKCPSSD